MNGGFLLAQNMGSDEVNSRKGSHLVRVKIPSDMLTIGMQVAKLDRDWEEVPVLFQDFVLQNQSDIDILKEYCVYVYIDLDEDYWNTVKHLFPVTHAQPIHPDCQALQKEYPKAEEAYSASKEHIYTLMEEVGRGNSIDLERSRECVANCVESVVRNPNAMFWLTRIKHQDNYTAEHCLRVSILSISFALHLGMSQAEAEEIGLAGLLHDVGKMKISPTILNKDGALTASEFKIIKEHPSLGYTFLKQHGGVPEETCNAALQHHERVDGRGYPQNLKSEHISHYSKIIAIIDTYDAVTSVRCYRNAYTPLQALNILYKEKDSHFDEKLVLEFIKMIGVYPPGSLVEMTNGETGIVLSANKEHKLKPKVEIILDSDGFLIKPFVVDLLAKSTDKEGKLYKIDNPLTDEDITLNLDDIIKDIY